MFEKSVNHDIYKMRLIANCDFEGVYNFPKVPGAESIPDRIIAFNGLKTERCLGDKWVHFFIDDYQFERLWNSPYKYLPMLKKANGVITPDFSLYSDMPRTIQIWNCYRNRVIAYWLWQNGIDIIPCVSWSDKESFSWCFDGLPRGSVLAVSNTGCLNNSRSKKMFVQGFAEMVFRLNPTKVIVYGREMPELKIYNIKYINSFSQDLHKRLK